MVQRLKDLWLEIRIQYAFHRFMVEHKRDQLRRKAKAFTDLIGRRSPAQVERMERAKGLR